MKRFIVFFAALAAVTVLFTGCGNMDNVSDNPNGIIEGSSQATESTALVTMPTESTRGTTFGTEETGTNGSEASTEDAPAARGRNPRRF